MAEEHSASGWDDDEPAPMALEEIGQQVAEFETSVMNFLTALSDKIGDLSRRVDEAVLALRGAPSGQTSDISDVNAPAELAAPSADGIPEGAAPVAGADSAPSSKDAIETVAADSGQGAPAGPHAARATAERAQSSQAQAMNF